MKKKMILVALLVAVMMVPAFAATKPSSFALGGQVGYPTGIAVTADIDFNEDWFMIADAGLLLGSGMGIAGDVLINWNFATLDGFRKGDAWEFSAGAGTGLGFFIGDNGFFEVIPKGDIRALYAFSEGWDLFLRVDLGASLKFKKQFEAGFGWGVSLGTTYAF